MIFATLCLGFVFLLLAYLAKNYKSYKIKQKHLEAVPGPKPLPLIGNALEISNNVDIFNKFKQWNQEHGNIFKVTVGPFIIYMISDLKLLEHIYTSNNLITKAHFYKFTHPWVAQGLITSTGEKWRQRRKAITPSFHFSILEKMLPVFEKHCQILIEQLKKKIGTKSFEISEIMAFCTLDIICETAMGVHHNTQEHKQCEFITAVRFIIQNVFQRTYSILGQNDFIYSFTKAYRKEQECLKIVHDFTDDIIKQKRLEIQQEIDQDTCDFDVGNKKKIIFLDTLLRVKINGEPIPDEGIREEVDSFLFAGHDTTAITMSFVFYILAKHPEIQQKVYEEVTEILFDNPKKHFTYSDLQNLKYTEMVIKETMRLYPTVPYVGREVTEEFEFNGYRFLKGSTLMLYIYGVHNDPKNYKNPEVFDPERWTQIMDGTNTFSYTPFSAGPRNCIGQKYAMLQMKSIIGKVIQNFKIVPAYPKQDLILANEGTLKSVNGINIAVEKRN